MHGYPLMQKNIRLDFQFGAKFPSIVQEPSMSPIIA